MYGDVTRDKGAVRIYGDAARPAERGAAAERIAAPRPSLPQPDGSHRVARAKRRAAAPLRRPRCVTDTTRCLTDTTPVRHEQEHVEP
jgi:hypothetical protein